MKKVFLKKFCISKVHYIYIQNRLVLLMRIDPLISLLSGTPNGHLPLITFIGRIHLYM